MSFDRVELREFSPHNGSVTIHVQGSDRAGIIAGATEFLEANGLYVESITFNLVLPRHDEYEMGIVARGNRRGIEEVGDLIGRNQFLLPAGEGEPVRIHWPTAYLCHVALHTTDRAGLTAEISRIVDKSRDVSSREQKGSFVHLVGITHNSAGVQGGTPYFSLRSNIATKSPSVQNQIISDLEDWARRNEIESDLWIRDLNP